MNDRYHRSVLARRLSLLGGLMQVVLVLVALGYGKVQVLEGAHFRSLADENRLRKVAIEAPRGRILDRYGRALAENVPRYNLELDRSLSHDRHSALDFAAGILGLPVAELEGRLEALRGTPSFKPVTLAEGLGFEAVARFSVERLEHPELEIGVVHRRLYRAAHQTAHLLGYLGEVSAEDLARHPDLYRVGDRIGRRGIEKVYDERLRGADGERVVVVDSKGRWIEEIERLPARPGSDLVLTIDLALQQRAAELMEDKTGAVVALDPRSGDVLALVSSPSFDPNQFSRRLGQRQFRQLLEHPHHPLQNRTIQNRYPPGSVFKIVMAFAALEQLDFDPREKVYCRGYSKIYNHRYRCWRSSGHGWVDLRDALKYSCNVYFHQLGQRLGIETIARYARRFGLGQATGIDLEGEQRGLVPDGRWSLAVRGTPWFPGETISVATGQGPILVTPLQVAVMMAAVANGGRLVRPRLWRDRPPPPPAHLPPLDPAALERVRDALKAVVNEPRATGRAARLEQLVVAGKTGTAQVVTQETWTANEELPPEQRDHAWFASFAPADDPQLVVVVFVEHGGAGSEAAAPLARLLYETFFDADLAHRTAA
ncbi:MAG: penicillin-binding protein 2 [Acidobacteria bacterium]|nr:MAG: penicillin-binding protein 2 [Acidobacteriota bacterium]